MENNIKEYNGFATPSFICEGSDTDSSGDVYDQYSTMEDGSKLVVGKWTKGFQDGLIHIWLIKPVTTLCEERQEWAAEKTLLREPIDYPILQETRAVKPKPVVTPKKQVVYDHKTKQFRML